MPEPPDNSRHFPRWKCMNCNCYVESSNDEIKQCPNCSVTGTLIKANEG